MDRHSFTDALATRLHPQRIPAARILTFGYNLRGFSDHVTNVPFDTPPGSTPVEDIADEIQGRNMPRPEDTDSAFSRRLSNVANTLITELYTDRGFNKCQQRPIIFVCHGLGGTIVKEALAQSEGHKTWSDITTGHSIIVSTHAILFFADSLRKYRYNYLGGVEDSTISRCPHRQD